VTAEGQELTVQVGKDFTITGTDRGHGGSGEEPLTGTTLEKVTAAVAAEYPDAEIERAETDADGVYEAHIVTADGQELTVQVGKDFTITGTQTDSGHGDRYGDDSD